MTITPQMVKELREQSGAGMMDAKKALEENGGNLEQAMDWLRQKGMAKAAKKSGRAAAEGMVLALTNGKTGIVVEVNAETDFAARNEQFASFAKAVAEAALAAGAADLDAVKALTVNGKTVEAGLTELIATVGENMQIRRYAKLEASNGVVGAYIHMNGKIGVLVALNGCADATIAKQVAMHVAANNPVALNRDSVDAGLLARETAIYQAQAAESGKPAPVVEKMVAGRVNKFLEESCLVEQPFVMDPDRKVAQVVDGAAKGATVAGFVRFGLGEGVEKEATDFAAEVRAAVAAA